MKVFSHRQIAVRGNVRHTGTLSCTVKNGFRQCLLTPLRVILSTLRGVAFAQGTQWRATAWRRDRRGRDGDEDRDRRDRGRQEVWSDPERERGREGSRGQADGRRAQRYRSKSSGCALGIAVKVSASPRQPRLTEDKDKIREAILYVQHARPGRLSQYDIVKAIFLADRSHLNQYGRPITFDNYTAMTHGPVPSLTYDLLKHDGEYRKYRAVYNADAPWTSVPAYDGAKKRLYTAIEPVRLEYLSQTDREALDTALQTVLSLSFGQLKRLTHEDPAYIEAWNRRVSDTGSVPIKFPLLIEENGEELAAELEYLSSVE